jgi:hypothetical protein
VPLLVPCHRVVRTDGTIGQYSLGGPGNKRRVLEAEGVDLRRLERLATEGVRFVGSYTTHIYCNPTCHRATRMPAPLHRVPYRRRGRAAGYRGCASADPSDGA